MPTNFHVNIADLTFILRQIRIAEDHATGISLPDAIQNEYGLSALNAALSPFGLRTVDGRLNNLLAGQEDFGAADTLFPRLLDPVWVNEDDGDSIDFDGAGPAPGFVQGNYAEAGNVVDADPRTISNLIVNQTIDNPAAVAAWFSNPLSLAQFEADHPGMTPIAPGAGTGDPNELEINNEDLANMPNQSPDVGLSQGFNSWMTFFGQFFDHGLDLVTKGENGTVYIPLQADDPLIAGADGIFGTEDDLPAHLQFMALTRATVTLDENGVPQAENTTTPFVDQNQTYTSNSSHQVFLREYNRVDLNDGAGLVTRSTGHLLDGSSVDGGLSNWGDVKANALEYLGIILNDFDVHNVPMVKVDQYGNFIPGENGFAQIVVEVTEIIDGVPTITRHFVEGTAAGLDVHNIAAVDIASFTPTPGATYTSVDLMLTNHQFLIDIAHHAAPGFHNHDNDPSTAAIQQVADVDRDFDGDGDYDISDIDTNGDFAINDADAIAYGDVNGDGLINLADMVGDVNFDGVVNAADFDRNSDGFLDADDFDINGDGILDAADLVADDNNGFTFDNEMLESHFITGDGRGNENIALTTVHSVFHSEHNRLVDEYKLTILESGDIDFINEWLLVDLEAGDPIPTDPALLDWDGARLFQAGRFVTEMQYQHLVFEEFARTISPNVDPFVFTNDAQIDPDIIAEFAHTVYRFGHSMLNDTVDRVDNNLDALNGDPQATLIEAFLNPQLFAESGANVGEIIANIARGATQDVGNAIDEFVVPALQSNLLGLPLDLAALNIARGRETGIPSLNETREQLYNDFGLADLQPYTSWLDFAQHMKNPQSIINFVAAYGTHATIEAEDTLDGKRNAALELFGMDVVGFNDVDGLPADRSDFLNGEGAYSDTGDHGLGGLNDVDLWIGGLAEQINEFGGMLGSTFNFIFEYQMEHLQTGDRFYYLSRTQGTNLLDQLEPNTFTDLVMRNSDLGDDFATHLSGTLFTTPDHIFELDRGIAQEDYNLDDPNSLDPIQDDPFLEAIDPAVVRDYTDSTVVDGHDFGGYFRYSGGAHVVVGGTEGDDTLLSGIGDDTIWGDGGNDYINAGSAADHVFGGDGDDIIIDPFGDDFLRGERGNDVISAGSGLDLAFGGAGQDYIILGQDDSEAFGGEGNDFILGGTGNDLVQGAEGNDWLEGGDGFDVIAGDNSELFFNSPIIGHDVMWGQGGDQDYDSESGDDIMISGPGIQRFEGQFGFDWAIASYDPLGADFDFEIGIFVNTPDNVLRDRFDLVEAASGWHYSDVISGDNRGHVAGASAPGFAPDTTFIDHILDEEGIARIDGMLEFLGGTTTGAPILGLETLFGTGATQYRDGNILMGGDGNDFITGRGGYDIIDGDAYMNVRINIDMGGGVNYTAISMTTDVNIAGPNAGLVLDMNGNAMFGGQSLNSLMLDGTLNPGQLSIVREILTDETPDDNVDIAFYQGTLAEYDIEGRVVDEFGTVITEAADLNGDGFISVADRDNGLVGATVDGALLPSRGVFTDDTDLLRNIERLEFADQTIVIAGTNELATGDVTINDPTPLDGLASPYVGQVLTASLPNAMDAEGLDMSSLTWEWQITQSTAGNTGWVTVGTSDSYTVTAADLNNNIRAVAVMIDGEGVTERIVSDATTDVTAPFNVAESSLAGTVVIPSIDFIVDGPTDGIIVQLTHVLADDAGGRFQIVDDGNGGQRVVVADGGPDNLNYEDIQVPVDDQYQIVIETYSDLPENGGVLLDTRQFTILLDDIAESPVDIAWNSVEPALDLPGTGEILATLETAPNTIVTYSDNGGSSPELGLTASGEVTANVALAENASYVLNTRTTETSSGDFYDETFNIRTGDNLGNDLSPFNTPGTDIFYGGAGNDSIRSGGGDDVIYGGAGDDFIGGGTGADIINGGSGVDTLFGFTGDDVINGGADNDVLRGGAGADAINGGSGIDTADYRDSTSGVTVDLELGIGLGGDAEGDTLSEIENAFGSGHADMLIGDAGNNVLYGFAGDDVINGGAGNDIIRSGEGADIINGGSGADTLLGFSGDDVINGGDDNDVLRGGAGADTINGGSGIDRVDYRNSTSGVTVNLELGTGLGGDAEGDTLSEIENAFGSGHVDMLIGDAGNNVFYAYGGDDVINGGAGNDIIRGGAGVDTINGGSDNDTISGDAGADVINGGSGFDTADYRNSISGVTVNLESGIGLGGHAEGDTLSEIERAFGSNHADMLIGDAGNNLLNGYAGDDIINGGAGNDVLAGGTGADSFIYDPNFGRDIIADFESNVDTLDLSNFGFVNVDAALAFATQTGENVVFDFGGGDRLVINNVTVEGIYDSIIINPPIISASLSADQVSLNTSSVNQMEMIVDGFAFNLQDTFNQDMLEGIEVLPNLSQIQTQPWLDGRDNDQRALVDDINSDAFLFNFDSFFERLDVFQNDLPSLNSFGFVPAVDALSEVMLSQPLMGNLSSANDGFEFNSDTFLEEFEILADVR